MLSFKFLFQFVCWLWLGVSVVLFITIINLLRQTVFIFNCGWIRDIVTRSWSPCTLKLNRGRIWLWLLKLSNWVIVHVVVFSSSKNGLCVIFYFFECFYRLAAFLTTFKYAGTRIFQIWVAIYNLSLFILLF